MKMKLCLLVLYVLTKIVVGQKPLSHCPEIFSYNPKIENNSWHGTLRLTPTENLTGVWLHITLDKPADLLKVSESWYGQVASSDHKEVVVVEPQYTLQPGISILVHIFVKFNPSEAIPSVEIIRLNGKTICPLTKQTATNNEQISKTIKPLSFDDLSANEDSSFDSDYYPGDFSPAVRSNNPKEVDYTSSSCGVVAPRALPLIVNGEETSEGQWPWHAALYRSHKTTLVYICGTTLISDQHILTPAHCVYLKKGIFPNNFLVSLGKHNLNKFEETVQDRSVSNIFIHPDYNPEKHMNNVAVLKLAKPVTSTMFVRPCCLWEGNSDFSKIIDKEGIIVGWGYENKDLLQAKMSITPVENCIASKSDKIYCAEFKNDTSACTKQSIGAMVFQREGTNGQIWQIRGILYDRNVGTVNDESCEMLHYLTFTDIARYASWIKQIVSDDSK